MVKFALLMLITAALAACGSDDTPQPAVKPAATEAPAADTQADPVGEYYGTPAEHPPGDPNADIEEEYHQPPKPLEAGVGETITLTGTNIGIRLDVTVTGTSRVQVDAKPYVAVELRIKNTGIAVHEDQLRGAALTFPGAPPVSQAAGVQAPCSRGFDGVLRIDVDRRAKGCLLFPASGSASPERFQLALELVPVAAGGIWKLG